MSVNFQTQIETVVDAVKTSPAYEQEVAASMAAPIDHALVSTTSAVSSSTWIILLAGLAAVFYAFRKA